jgi:hypothetical protein
VHTTIVGPSDVYFQNQATLEYYLAREVELVFDEFFVTRRVRTGLRLYGGWRVLEMVVDSREATHE